MSDDEIIKGVSIERQMEGERVMSEITTVIEYIAKKLVKIWGLWGEENCYDTYYYNVHKVHSEDKEYGISFMESGCKGDPPRNPYHLFEDKERWIEDYVSLSRENIADPEAFLSKHRLYTEEYDECCRKSEGKKEENKKAERRRVYQALKREFGMRGVSKGYLDVIRMTDNLVDEVKAELERNKKLLKYYDSIPNGWSGASAIRIGIKAGEEALMLDERVKMVQALSLMRINIKR